MFLEESVSLRDFCRSDFCRSHVWCFLPWKDHRRWWWRCGPLWYCSAVCMLDIFHIKTIRPGVGAMAQQVKCLTCKHNDLSLDPWHSCRKLGMILLIIQMLREQSQNDPWGPWPAMLDESMSSSFKERACVENIRWRVTNEDIRRWLLSSMYMVKGAGQWQL